MWSSSLSMRDLVLRSSDSFHQGSDMALSPFSEEKQLCNTYSRLFIVLDLPSHLIWSLLKIVQKEALVLRGYRLHVSPARERRIEVLERQQSQVLN